MRGIRIVWCLLLIMLIIVTLIAGCAKPAAPPAAPPAATPAPEKKEEPAPVAEEKPVYTLTLAGASPGGLWSLLGEGVNNAIAKAYPGSNITYEVSSGVANIGLVTGGDVEMGITHNVEAQAAVLGIDVFSKPVSDIYALAFMYNWSPHQLVIQTSFANRHGIKKVEDILAVKPPIRVIVNQRGNMVEAMNRTMFKYYGFSYEDIEKWGGQIIYAPSSEAADLMKDRRADLHTTSLFAPHSSIIEIGRSVDVQLLPVRDDVIKAVNKEWGTDPYVIKAGTYDWVTEDVPTFALGAMIIINKDVPEQTAYNLAKALVENIDEIKGVHVSMGALTPELMVAQNVVPFHPGALRYYREVGLIK